MGVSIGWMVEGKEGDGKTYAGVGEGGVDEGGEVDEEDVSEDDGDCGGDVVPEPWSTRKKIVSN